MEEFGRPIETTPEPSLYELVTELDSADFAVIRSYGRYINIPTERNYHKRLDDISHLYHSFGKYLQKLVHGDIEKNERVPFATTALVNIIQKHHGILAEYQTDQVIVMEPEWEDLESDLSDDLMAALDNSDTDFTNVAIDRLQFLIGGEDIVLMMLAKGVQQRRIEFGRRAVSHTKDLLKISAGTVIGFALWNKYLKKD